MQHSTFSKAYTRPKHRTHTQLYGDATESAVAVGLGRLSYTARVMDGESVPIWLNFGVGKGLLCSPRLSWVVCFAAARLFPDRRGARGFPGSPARHGTGAAPPGPPSHGQNPEVGSFCTRPPTANSGPAEQVRGHLQGKEWGGVPHTTVLQRPGPPCRLGKRTESGTRHLLPLPASCPPGVERCSGFNLPHASELPGQLCPSLPSC